MMRAMLGMMIATGAAAMIATAATGQPAPMVMAPVPATPCPAIPAPLPTALAGWAAPTPLGAAPDGARAAQLAIGHAALVRLLPTAAVAYPVPPGHPGASGSHGGILGFAVTAPGTYRVALDAAAWIDVIANGATLVSTAHGHGPPCSGIAKTVDFALVPGRYLLQIAASAEPVRTVMVVSAG